MEVIATIAICEEYGVNADGTLRGPARRPSSTFATGPERGERRNGGWRYQPREGRATLVMAGWVDGAQKRGRPWCDLGRGVRKSGQGAVYWFLLNEAPPGGGCGAANWWPSGVAGTAISTLLVARTGFPANRLAGGRLPQAGVVFFISAAISLPSRYLPASLRGG